MVTRFWRGPVQSRRNIVPLQEVVRRYYDTCTTRTDYGRQDQPIWQDLTTTKASAWLAPSGKDEQHNRTTGAAITGQRLQTGAHASFSGSALAGTCYK